MIRIRFLLALGLLAALNVRQAEAHAQLIEASPPDGSVVPVSPGEIRLRFSEGVEPRFSGGSVTDASGSQVAGRPSADPNNAAQMIFHLNRRLPPGAYRVNWHVISVDSHRIEGSFTFEVRP